MVVRGVRDGGEIRDAEVDASGFVAGCLGLDFVFAHDVEFPFVAVPDGSHLSNVLDNNIWSSLDFAEDEVRPVFFEVSTFGEANPIVVSVVFEAVFFERDR